MNKNFFKYFCLLSFIIYTSSWISPQKVWIAGFISLGIPFILILNLIFTIYLSLRRKFSPWVLFGLLAGIGFMHDSFVWNKNKNTHSDFSVLSYNLRNIQEDHPTKNYMIYSKGMVDWIIKDTSQIKCLQEFGNPSEENHQRLIYNLERKGYNKTKQKNEGHNTGLVIFSKYPILHQSTILRDQDIKNRHNGAIYVDLKIKEDTIRVYNVHLESMGINQKKLTQKKNVFLNYKEIGEKLKNGMQMRAKQAGVVIKHIQKSPYPVILCGDFNDPPYSYAYQEYIKDLKNSFTEKGRGFGFTFNGPLFFLRIDNQFYSKGIEATNFKTLYDVTYSDHFPIQGNYVID